MMRDVNISPVARSVDLLHRQRERAYPPNARGYVERLECLFQAPPLAAGAYPNVEWAPLLKL